MGNSWHYWLLVSVTLVTVLGNKDYYDLLGVQKDATNRDIRRAFKKLALILHPDKNQDDPGAHEGFLKVNRAYEVLKDEGLRKKYDTHGEAGLKDDFHGGRKYESWNFYNQNFGIYDEDPEIVTLSQSDFDQAVSDQEAVWFINFYSVNCGHCHDLAPTWREVAKELDGVVRIGAVNCQEEWMLCRQHGIHSYPSLVMYPQRAKYHGDRTKAALLKYALQQIRVAVHDLWSENFRSKMDAEELVSKPWLISFCGDGGDCLLQQTCQKLAAMLVDLVNIGSLDCFSNVELCQKLGIDHGTYFFEPGYVKKDHGLAISTLDYKEVAYRVLEQLPDVKILDAESFREAKEQLKAERDTPWLIHFVEDDGHDLELRKLPALLSDMNVGRVDCRKQRGQCNDLHIHKFPTFAVFKVGGGYEIQHGRSTAHDVASFAKDSSRTSVRVLGPEDFPLPVTGSGEPWFVDFYAPWCPPCMRLLPEFRKASKSMSNIYFGTVDCTVHSQLCQKHNVGSYPTTIFYNQSTPHHYHGHHMADHMVQFLEDTLRPPVLMLDPSGFKKNLRTKSPETIWLVDYYAPWCGPCQQLASEWRQLAKMFKDRSDVKVAQLDCQAHADVCRGEGVHSYPTIRLYPLGSTDTKTFEVYSGWHRDADNLRAWAFEFLPSAVRKVPDWSEFHQSVLQSAEPWIIDFYAPWCGHCQVFAPEFERVAEAMKGRVRAGKVDCDVNQWVCQRAGIHSYPTVRFYEGAQSNQEKNIYGEDIEQNADYIISYLGQKVPHRTNGNHDEL